MAGHLFVQSRELRHWDVQSISWRSTLLIARQLGRRSKGYTGNLIHLSHFIFEILHSCFFPILVHCRGSSTRYRRTSRTWRGNAYANALHTHCSRWCVDAVYDMTRYGMMSEIASTCSTSETGRHNHRKVAAKIPIIGIKTPDPLKCVTRSGGEPYSMFFLLPTRNGCRKGKTRSRLSYWATGRKQPPYLYPLSPAKLETFRDIFKRTRRRDLSDRRRVLTAHSAYWPLFWLLRNQLYHCYESVL
jgi:hypothetical protein